MPHNSLIGSIGPRSCFAIPLTLYHQARDRFAGLTSCWGSLRPETFGSRPTLPPFHVDFCNATLGAVKGQAMPSEPEFGIV